MSHHVCWLSRDLSFLIFLRIRHRSRIVGAPESWVLLPFSGSSPPILAASVLRFLDFDRSQIEKVAVLYFPLRLPSSFLPSSRALPWHARRRFVDPRTLGTSSVKRKGATGEDGPCWPCQRRLRRPRSGAPSGPASAPGHEGLPVTAAEGVGLRARKEGGSERSSPEGVAAGVGKGWGSA